MKRIYTTVSNLLKLLSSREKSRAFQVLGATTLVSVLEVIGISSVFPLLTLLANPSEASGNQLIVKILNFFKFIGFESESKFLLFLGVGYLVLFLTITLLRLFVLYIQTSFVYSLETSVAEKLIKNYLGRSYEKILEDSISRQTKAVIADTSVVVQHGFMPILTVYSQSLVAIFLAIILYTIEPIITTSVLAGAIMIYILIYVLVRRRLDQVEGMRRANDTKRFAVTKDILLGAKEIILSGTRDDYFTSFAQASRSYMKSLVIGSLISQFPRYLVEGLGIGGAILLLIYLTYRENNLTAVLPLIGIFVFAIYRLLPAIQQIYNSITIIHSNIGVIESVCEYLLRPVNSAPVIQASRVIEYKGDIALNGVSHKFSNSKKDIIHNLNLTVPFGARVGIVAESGGGKSTLVNIIAGLITPKFGSVTVDGILLTCHNRSSWFKDIGYVAQKTYFLDDSIATNIAFGVNSGSLDTDRIIEVAKIVGLDQIFGLEIRLLAETQIGEGGSLISGGQRQRIAIARALYRNPKLIILDEATAGLDEAAETRIIKNIASSMRGSTLIIVSHNLNVYRWCDEVYKLEGGHIEKYLGGLKN